MDITFILKRTDNLNGMSELLWFINGFGHETKDNVIHLRDNGGEKKRHLPHDIPKPFIKVLIIKRSCIYTLCSITLDSPHSSPCGCRTYETICCSPCVSYLSPLVAGQGRHSHVIKSTKGGHSWHSNQHVTVSHSFQRMSVIFRITFFSVVSSALYDLWCVGAFLPLPPHPKQKCLFTSKTIG